MTTGLILGKFYPPHAGHHYLIDYADEKVDRLVVLIWWSEKESISARWRKKILEEMHPDVEIYTQQCEIEPDYEDASVWDAHIDLLWSGPEIVGGDMPSYIQQFAHEPWDASGHPTNNDFDFVFTSEEYGWELARRLNADHVLVDHKRVNMPVSGTAVRDNPAGNWRHLAEPTRALLTKRFVVTGAESTGSTTLARSLANHYDTVWVPEYGRFYTEGTGLLGHEWTEDEFVHIATEQNRIEDFMARKAGPVMFCDTDALSTGVWCERYTWKRSELVEKLIRPYEHYFITDYAEVPLEDDGLRDGNNDVRKWMQARLIERINKVREERDTYGITGVNIMLGGPRMRMAHVIDVVDEHIKEGWNLNDPL